MSYKKLLGLDKDLSDCEIIRILHKSVDVQIDSTVIHKPSLTQKDVSGDWGEPTPN